MVLKGLKFTLLLLTHRCIVNINVLWLFLTVLWVGLQCVVVVFPDHTHLLLEHYCAYRISVNTAFFVFNSLCAD